MNSGKVFLVGAGPGDPGLLTIRGREALETCDVVIYDRLVNEALLAHVSPHAERISLADRHESTCRLGQRDVERLLIDRARQGLTVVRLKGGDPFLFGRGGEEIEALTRAGVSWTVVPGVSAGLAVPAYAGIPITHRQYASSVTFVTGHPSDEGQPVSWSALGRGEGTLVVFMGLKNLPHIVSELLLVGRAADTPIAIISRGTLPEQRILTSTLGKILEEGALDTLATPALLVVGQVVRFPEQLASLTPEATREPALIYESTLVGDAH